jgi:hypothetical protein
MPSKWYDRVIKDGKLTYYNDAGMWKSLVGKAVDTFNNHLPFGITIDKADNHIGANIVVRISQGSGQDPDFSWAKANFDAENVHGQTVANVDRKNRVDKAVIFLPGKLKKVKDDIKVLVIVHELIHACGLVEKNDHDPVGGILYAKLQLMNDKLYEPSGDSKIKIEGMPPVRVGAWTQCQMNHLWNKGGCADEN